MSRGKRVWVVFAALAAALLPLQLFTRTAPMAVAHEQETTTSQAEAAVFSDPHVPEATSEHFLTPRPPAGRRARLGRVLRTAPQRRMRAWPGRSHNEFVDAM